MAGKFRLAAGPVSRTLWPKPSSHAFKSGAGDAAVSSRCRNEARAQQYQGNSHPGSRTQRASHWVSPTPQFNDRGYYRRSWDLVLGFGRPCSRKTGTAYGGSQDSSRRPRSSRTVVNALPPCRLVECLRRLFRAGCGGGASPGVLCDVCSLFATRSRC